MKARARVSAMGRFFAPESARQRKGDGDFLRIRSPAHKAARRGFEFQREFWFVRKRERPMLRVTYHLERYSRKRALGKSKLFFFLLQRESLVTPLDCFTAPE